MNILLNDWLRWFSLYCDVLRFVGQVVLQWHNVISFICGLDNPSYNCRQETRQTFVLCRRETLNCEWYNKRYSYSYLDVIGGISSKCHNCLVCLLNGVMWHKVLFLRFPNWPDLSWLYLQHSVFSVVFRFRLYICLCVLVRRKLKFFSHNFLPAINWINQLLLFISVTSCLTELSEV